ncbi:alpha/beta hydrolase-fold protein [Gordonia humi]|uniref:alpha/beta hydrolase-fold protein n=1 Tax=Gordonia humi TaxID=686429 RepID=UPI00362266D4
MSLAVVVSVITATSVITVGTADAAPAAQTWWIDSCGMPTQSKGGPAHSVKVRAWTKPGNRKTVVMLDGLRATNDVSGWEHNTRVGPDLAAKGVNVIQPVGGYMSFYSDWNTPDNFSRQGYTYKWNCVISKSLVGAMDRKKLRGPSGKYAIMGLSMSGSSALIIAGNNKNDFDSAASLSGYLNLTAPGMREAIRAAMIVPALDGGTPAMNVDAMWGAAVEHPVARQRSVRADQQDARSEEAVHQHRQRYPRIHGDARRDHRESDAHPAGRTAGAGVVGDDARLRPASYVQSRSAPDLLPGPGSARLAVLERRGVECLPTGVLPCVSLICGESPPSAPAPPDSSC